MSAPSRIEVWHVDLAAAAPTLLARDRELALMCPHDSARIDRLADPIQRQERRVSHLALRHVIERHAGPRFRARTFTRLPSGKPVLADTGLDFSLSHVAGHALVGIVREGLIGVDLERIRSVAIDERRRDLIEAAAGAACHAEPLPVPSSRQRFQQSWTRLEAIAKARGIGMAHLLSLIGVVPRAVQATGPCSPDAEDLAANLTVLDLALDDDDLVGSLAVSPPPATRIAVGAFPHDPQTLTTFLKRETTSS